MIETDRLILRNWRDADRAPFAAINADEEVMRYFPSKLAPAQSNAVIDRLHQHICDHGFGFWALEHRETQQFMGFVGFQNASEAVPCAPAVEIGWRLDKRFWGRGYAPEAAQACLDVAFGTMAMREIVSFTARTNLPSQRVMEKIGMMRDPEGDFDHPAVEAGHPLRPHVLFRLRAPS